MSLSIHDLACAKRARRSSRRSGRVVTQRVDPLVWAVALDYVSGDVRRLEIIDRNTVVVKNHPRGEHDDESSRVPSRSRVSR